MPLRNLVQKGAVMMQHDTGCVSSTIASVDFINNYDDVQNLLVGDNVDL